MACSRSFCEDIAKVDIGVRELSRRRVDDARGGVGPQADDDHAERSDRLHRDRGLVNLGRAFDGQAAALVMG